LSSDVETNRRFKSTNVMVFTAPRWRSYSWTTSPERTSHYLKKTQHPNYKHHIFQALHHHTLGVGRDGRIACCHTVKIDSRNNFW